MMVRRDDGKGWAPWGQEGLPPQVEEFFKQVRKWFGGGYIGIAIIIGFAILVLAYTCFYSIQPGELGVVQRFGRFVRMAEPGLNFKLPAGIEKVTKLKVQYIYTEEFGFRTVRAGVRTEYAPSRQYLDESLMLTGDLNTALVPWVVQFRIGDPYKFLFKVSNVRETLRDLSEAVMRRVVGDRSINEVIGERLEIATTAKQELQNVLNDAETGITVVNVELKKTTVPEPVQPSFNEVNQSLQEKEKMIYQAREAYNKVVPEAKGDAERMISEAEGYALERINNAKGDAARFLSLWQEYSKAKDVTRRRLYLEAMREVLPKLGNKYIVDPDQGGLLPLLNLSTQKPEATK
jgi:membrane protease subunit HflK